MSSNDHQSPRSKLSPLQRALLAIEELEEKLAASEAKQSEPLAIVGIGCRFPGDVVDVDGLVNRLRVGASAESKMPADGRTTYRGTRPELSADECEMPPAGFLSQDVAQFDPQFFNIAPREAVGMDPQQRLLLEVAWEALEDAAESPDYLYESNAGVFVGVCGNDYAQMMIGSRDPEMLNPHLTSGVGHSVVSGRLSYLLGLRGPSLSIDTACSSSLVATHLACRSLRSGECDVALAGGVNLILDSDLTVAFARGGMLSADGRCKAFAAGADGFGRAEGCGVVVIKRLSTALADNSRIYAVIRGTAVNQDGASSALSAPNGPAQEAVIRAALDDGALSPDQVQHVETHGTGTELGDPIEARALGAVYGAARSGSEPLLVGSAKTNFGHLESTAGIAGLIKAAVSLEQEFIPKHLHWTTPSPHIEWSDLNLEVVGEMRTWPKGDVPRRAGVSSFGFSGTNCHIVLEEAPSAERAKRAQTPNGARLATLSAATKPALLDLAKRYQQHFQTISGDVFDASCATSQIGRAHLSHRLAVIGHGPADVAEKLGTWAGSGWADGVAEGREPVDPPRVAFAFTGQGSQYAGMALSLYEAAPLFRQTLDACREPYQRETGADLIAVLADEQALQDTSHTQPVLFALEVALANFLMQLGLRPAALFGHSLGEYSAACIAGVFSIEDGIKITALRGRLMQESTGVGGMLAVAADEKTMVAACQDVGDDVVVAAVNGPQAVVLSGRVDAIESLQRRFDDRGTRATRLEVQRAFHSPLMDPILDKFESAVAELKLRAPRLRLVSALTGKTITASEATSPAYWRRHLREAVRFADATTACADHASIVVEVGPHQVLSTFVREGAAEALSFVPTLRRGADDWESLLSTLQALYAQGVKIDFANLHQGAELERSRLPLYPFQRAHYWATPAAVSVDAAKPSAFVSHPLLGRSVESPLADQYFQAPIARGSHGFLDDHRVSDAVIMPGAGFLEAARGRVRGDARTSGRTARCRIARADGGGG